jgi:hypothetical protein
MKSQLGRWTGSRRKAGTQMRGDLDRQVGSIKSATAAFLLEFANAHRKMAKQQEAALKSGHRKLRAEMAKTVDAIHADRMKAHEIWAAFKLPHAA